MGVPSLWTAQVIQDIIILYMQYKFYLKDDDVIRTEKFGRWVEDYKNSPYNTNGRAAPFSVAWETWATHLSKKIRRENKDHEWANFR